MGAARQRQIDLTDLDLSKVPVLDQQQHLGCDIRGGDLPDLIRDNAHFAGVDALACNLGQRVVNELSPDRHQADYARFRPRQRLSSVFEFLPKRSKRSTTWRLACFHPRPVASRRLRHLQTRTEFRHGNIGDTEFLGYLDCRFFPDEGKEVFPRDLLHVLLRSE